jgi:hypothetical protein
MSMGSHALNNSIMDLGSVRSGRSKWGANKSVLGQSILSRRSGFKLHVTNNDSDSNMSNSKIQLLSEFSGSDSNDCEVEMEEDPTKMLVESRAELRKIINPSSMPANNIIPEVQNGAYVEGESDDYETEESFDS